MAAGIVLLLVSVSAFLFALLALDILKKAFEQYEQRYVARATNDLGAMFLFIDPRQILMLNIAALLFCACAGYCAGGFPLGTSMAVAGFFAPVGAVRFYRRRRVKRFDAQLTGALQQMSNSLRAGLTLQQAVDQVGRDWDPPLGQEFALLTKEVKLGVAAEEALANLAGRIGSEDVELVATSTNVARQMGGNLAEMFETIAATIRERFRLEGKIRALTSQGKMQGLIVSTLPFLIGLFFASVRPDLMAPMFESAFGYVLLSIVVVLEAIGFLLIRKIVAIDV